MWFTLPTGLLLLHLAEPVTVTARLAADKLEIGPEYSFTVSVAVADGYTTTRTGGPPPILQIQAPPSIELIGAVRKSVAERSYRGFMYEPFARVIGPGSSTIRFTLRSPPAAGEAFGLNIVGYVAAGDGGPARFFRERRALPLAPSAEGQAAAAEPGAWSDEPILKLGDKAAPFVLKRFYQPDVSLTDFAGRPLVITTYRSFLSVPCQRHLTALHENYGEFERRGVPVLAVAQEDIDAETHANIRKGLPEKPLYLMAADLPPMSQTAAYERVTTYVIDATGVVRQILPGTIEQRAPWSAVLSEIDRLGLAKSGG